MPGDPNVSRLWASAVDDSLEHVKFEMGGRPRVAGTAVLPIDQHPATVRWWVELDEAWATRAVHVQVTRAAPWELRLETDEGRRWFVDGAAREDLDGCLDVDLGWTPATNTFPIRRLGLAVGESQEIEAAWVLFPELEVVRGRQRYTRTAADRWEYASEGFRAELLVDPAGVVLTYGDIWTTVASG